MRQEVRYSIKKHQRISEQNLGPKYDLFINGVFIKRFRFYSDLSAFVDKAIEGSEPITVTLKRIIEV